MNTTTVADSGPIAHAAVGAETRGTIAALAQVQEVPAPPGWERAKRCLDVALSVLLVLAMLPVLLLIAIAIKIDSPGPVLFRQRRHGRHRNPFMVLKFRTMRADASPEMHRQYIASLASGQAQDDGLKKLQMDPRVTRVGRLLRKTSLDELPQLVNVIRGEMSLVGPRPAIDYELEFYDDDHFERFRVRPGLTGLWQVSGRNELGFREMLALDVEYAREPTLKRDAMILARTPLALIRGRAA